MARPKSGRQTDELRCRINTTLKSKLDMHLYNPATGQIKYGALGTLVEGLLQHFITYVERVGPDKAFAHFGISIAAFQGIDENGKPNEVEKEQTS